uniref:Mitochondrial import inner membrane translocase subunit TIM22 n=1 Tax=Albugo laibachii Nc14 TaxID=890382 RepID=F0WGX2_9STRA|nr:Mitochondrial Protein Translocase (MPT) Family puta [Albugo laibachii Nc14]|eukprot:CCA20487.1 Mitochondrial Protein Translocase (MPT) Family puta [Albugo laibachii Nc14]
MTDASQWRQQIDAFLLDARESCWKKSMITSIAGVGMGVGLGTFLGTFEGAHGELIGDTMRQQLLNGFRQSARSGYLRSVYFAKEFAMVGALYAGTECLVARERASDDIYTTLIAGGTTGTILGAFNQRNAHRNVMLRHTLKSAAGFALFAVVIEKVVEHVSD